MWGLAQPTEQDALMGASGEHPRQRHLDQFIFARGSDSGRGGRCGISHEDHTSQAERGRRNHQGVGNVVGWLPTGVSDGWVGVLERAEDHRGGDIGLRAGWARNQGDGLLAACPGVGHDGGKVRAFSAIERHTFFYLSGARFIHPLMKW